MAEWSNAPDLRSGSFGSVGSNPTLGNFFVFYFCVIYFVMIVYMATKKDVKKEINKVEQMLNQLCDDNSLLKSENDALIEKVRVLEERWNRFQNTDAILKKVMEEKNKWWFLDSIEESLYRNVIEIIQNI